MASASRAGVLALLLLAPGCAAVIDQPGLALVVVDRTDTGDHVELDRDQRLEVRLASNPTTGYEWRLVDQTAGLLRADDASPRYERTPGTETLIGAGGVQIWTFRPAGDGTGLLRFEYRRPWENGRQPIDSVVFRIRVRAPASRPPR